MLCLCVCVSYTANDKLIYKLKAYIFFLNRNNNIKCVLFIHGHDFEQTARGILMNCLALFAFILFRFIYENILQPSPSLYNIQDNCNTLKFREKTSCYHFICI